MPKFFIDCEFIEGFHKPLFGKRRHFIDLISIAIVCEDGKEYYAISNEFNPKDADQWVKDNVISKLPKKNVTWNPQGGESPSMLRAGSLYKSNEAIAYDILAFVYPGIAKSFVLAQSEFLHRSKEYGWNAEQPVFYGYFADYDWVLFCSLFGRMIDLPKGFPMYCRDLKQRFDEEFNDTIKKHPRYPVQKDEHNALADAKWNRDLHAFMESYLDEKI